MCTSARLLKMGLVKLSFILLQHIHTHSLFLFSPLAYTPQVYMFFLLPLCLSASVRHHTVDRGLALAANSRPLAFPITGGSEIGQQVIRSSKVKPAKAPRLKTRSSR